MKSLCLLAAILLAVVLFVAPTGASLAAPPKSAVDFSKEEGARKLSADLVQRLEAGDDSLVLVQIIITPDAEVREDLLVSPLRSHVFADTQWITAEASAGNLAQLAASADVLAVVSSEAAQPVTAPETTGDKDLDDRSRTLPMVVQELDVTRAWDLGYRGEGIVAAICDSGVDFGHPDLAGAQARCTTGAYAGWPMAYWPTAAFYYASRSQTLSPDNLALFGSDSYCETLPLPDSATSGTAGVVELNWGFDDSGATHTQTVQFPLTSASGNYLYTVHPSKTLAQAAASLGLSYATTVTLPAVVLVVDETEAGVYDTVYVDVDFDGDLRDEKAMRKGDELAGADVLDGENNPGRDGFWDLSAGMLAWVSDGVNYPPGLTALYPDIVPDIPAAGRIIVFIGDEQGHGTSCACDIAGRGVTTDPYGIGMINPFLAGAGEVGGTGDPVLTGVAPEARIFAFQSGYSLPMESFTIAGLGFDRAPMSGDEPDIVNNSWGSSGLMENGWDFISRYQDSAAYMYAPSQVHLCSTGNGGHGFGTVRSPNGSASIGVGASTSFGSMYRAMVPEDLFNWGSLIYFSNRGPSQNGRLAPHVLAPGKSGVSAYPLNISIRDYDHNGQAAYEYFGGTSMACPVASGVMCLVYQAYHEANGAYPTFSQARELLMAGATDLGYDPLAQGAGNVNALRSVEMALGDRWRATPSLWEPALNEGANAPSFAPVLEPGQATSVTFTLENASVDAAWTARAERLVTIYQQTTSFSLPAVTDAANPFLFIVPDTDIVGTAMEFDPDLVRIRLRYPLEALSPEDDATTPVHLQLGLVDWIDRDGDGVFWHDANEDGLAQPLELETDLANGVLGYIGTNMDYAAGNVLETSIGRDALSRVHDGLFATVQLLRTGIAVSPVTVEITYLRRTPWDWVTVDQPTGDASAFQATIAVPDEPGLVGVHEGIIKVGDGASTQTLPVVVNIAAPSAVFAFGAESFDQLAAETPYDNTAMLGGINWNWRPEQGDWRLYFFNLGEADAPAGTRLLLDVAWEHAASDIDAFLLTPDYTDMYSARFPDLFGPHGMSMSGSLVSYTPASNFSNTQYLPNTITGGPREIISAPAVAGLNGVVLHQVLTSGEAFAEPFVGKVSSFRSSPDAHELSEDAGTFAHVFGTSWDVESPLVVETWGLSPVDARTEQPATQDDPDESRSASWVEKIEIADAAYLEVVTSSFLAGLDMDLFIYRDEGNGVWDGVDGAEEQVGSSTSSTSNESVFLMEPEDGTYFVTVLGWGVPTPEATFDVSITAVQGHDGLSLEGDPPATVTANEPTTLTFNYERPGSGVHRGVFAIGTEDVPRMAIVHVTAIDPSLIPTPTPTPAPVEDDEFEDNDTIQTATEIGPGEYPNLVSAVGDMDVFHVSVEAGDGITATITFDSAVADLWLYLISESGQLLDLAHDTGGVATVSQEPAGSDTPYYLGVENHGAVANHYTLLVESPVVAATPTPTPTATPSCEGMDCMIIHFYNEILQREPGPGEVAAWRQGYFDWLVAQNIDVRFVPSEMGRQFFLSEEYGALGADDAGFITDTYNAFLYREPKDHEMSGWTPVANRAEAVSIFSNSDEFQDRVVEMFPGLDGDGTRNFVATMYLGLLDRLPDPGGLAYFADEFNAADDKRARAKLMGREVCGSDEYMEKRGLVTELQVESLYRAYLGRYPNDAEMAYWVSLDDGTVSLGEVIDAFADSPEFAERLVEYFGADAVSGN